MTNFEDWRIMVTRTPVRTRDMYLVSQMADVEDARFMQEQGGVARTVRCRIVEALRNPNAATSVSLHTGIYTY